MIDICEADHIHKRGLLRVDLEWIGEGLDGDFDPDDPDDVPLVRFTVFWADIPVFDGSYCTQVPATINLEQKETMAEIIMNELETYELDNWKRPMEKLSQITLDEIDAFINTGTVKKEEGMALGIYFVYFADETGLNYEPIYADNEDQAAEAILLLHPEIEENFLFVTAEKLAWKMAKKFE